MFKPRRVATIINLALIAIILVSLISWVPQIASVVVRQLIFQLQISLVADQPTEDSVQASARPTTLSGVQVSPTSVATFPDDANYTLTAEYRRTQTEVASNDQLTQSHVAQRSETATAEAVEIAVNQSQAEFSITLTAAYANDILTQQSVALTPTATATTTATSTELPTSTSTETSTFTPTMTPSQTLTSTPSVTPLPSKTPMNTPTAPQLNMGTSISNPECRAMIKLDNEEQPQLHEWPSTAALLLDQLATGVSVKVLFDNTPDPWVWIESDDGAMGWLESRFLERDCSRSLVSSLGEVYALDVSMPLIIDQVYPPDIELAQDLANLWRIISISDTTAVLREPQIGVATIPPRRTIAGREYVYDLATVNHGVLRLDVPVDPTQYRSGATMPYTVNFGHAHSSRLLRSFAVNAAYLATNYVPDAYVGLRYTIPDDGSGVTGFYEILAGLIDVGGDNPLCGVKLHMVVNGEVVVDDGFALANDPELKIASSCSNPRLQNQIEVHQINRDWSIWFNGQRLRVSGRDTITFPQSPLDERLGMVELVVQNTRAEFFYIVAAGG